MKITEARQSPRVTGQAPGSIKAIVGMARASARHLKSASCGASTSVALNLSQLNLVPMADMFNHKTADSVWSTGVHPVVVTGLAIGDGSEGNSGASLKNGMLLGYD
ncbi:hypothetical protein AnigIFM59636_000189 [Aspergillus niger]|nr:hypothetical protein AnigIFM59636_000189 [Aspergillus niger]